MPGMDEEFAKELGQHASSLAQRQLYRMGGRGGPKVNPLNLKERAGKILEKMRFPSDDALARARATAEDEAIAAAEAAGVKDPVVQGYVSDAGVPYLHLVARDSEDAAELSRLLAENNLEHHIDMRRLDFGADGYMELGEVVELGPDDHLKIMSTKLGFRQKFDGKQLYGLIEDPQKLYLMDEEPTQLFVKDGDDWRRVINHTGESLTREIASGDAALEFAAVDFEKFGRNEDTGLFDIFVPDRKAQETFDPGKYPNQVIVGSRGEYTLLGEIDYSLRSELDLYAITSAQELEALKKAASEASEDVYMSKAHVDLDSVLKQFGLTKDEVLGSEFKVCFETIAKDPESGMVSSFFDRAGIDYSLSVIDLPDGGERGLVEYTMREAQARYVKETVDRLIDTESCHCDVSRFSNYSELARVADEGVNPTRRLDDSYRTGPLKPDELHYLREALDKMEIPYKTESVDDGMEVLSVETDHLKQLSHKLNNAAEVMESIKPPEFKEQAQKTYERSSKVLQNTKRQQERLAQNQKRAQQNTRSQRNQKARLEKDQVRAKKSADAQRKVAAGITRKPTIGSK